MRINQDIFKAYDIRGRFPREVSLGAARLIGNATAVFLSKKARRDASTFIVGTDVRESSPVLKKALIEGITLQGSSVIDIGIVTTPLFYFALYRSGREGGVMITASHNPPGDNGFKIRGKGSEPIAAGSGMEVIKKLAARRRMTLAKRLGKIKKEHSWEDQYVSYLVKRAKIGKARIVIDAAGGSAAPILPKLLSHFPRVIYKPLFFTPDGKFIRHNPNPLLPEAQEFIKEELLSGSFDFGVVFDGDGDRIVFFDESGNEIRGDFITALISAEMLKTERNAAVIIDPNASRAVEEHIFASGGKPHRAKRGYPNVVCAMKKERAIFGGEVSDHFYFRELNCNESSMLALLKVLEIVSRTPKKLSHLIRPLQKYVSAPEMNFSVRSKAKVIKEVFKKFGKGGRISRLDGLSVDFPDWWFNIRPSNTEPLVRLTVEASTRQLFEEKRRELREFIEKAGN